MSFTEQTATGSTNGTTPVTMLTATARSVIRNITIYNKDTAAVTVTVSTTGSELFKVTLQSGYRLVCDDHLVLGTGSALSIVLSGAITTSNPTYSVTFAVVS